MFAQWKVYKFDKHYFPIESALVSYWSACHDVFMRRGGGKNRMLSIKELCYENLLVYMLDQCEPPIIITHEMFLFLIYIYIYIFVYT